MPMMGRCGLMCDLCPAYIGTQEGDQELLEETALTWSREFGYSHTAKEILCDGCLPADGRQSRYCQECRIRVCAVERGLESCGDCPEYACTRLEEFFAMAPEAREALEDRRAGLD